jgi:hypothetical protein
MALHVKTSTTDIEVGLDELQILTNSTAKGRCEADPYRYLHNLRAELFAQVIHEYVETAGVMEAWYVRNVKHKSIAVSTWCKD